MVAPLSYLFVDLSGIEISTLQIRGHVSLSVSSQRPSGVAVDGTAGGDDDADVKTWSAHTRNDFSFISNWACLIITESCPRGRKRKNTFSSHIASYEPIEFIYFGRERRYVEVYNMLLNPTSNLQYLNINKVHESENKFVYLLK